jgi:hypothetical protein
MITIWVGGSIGLFPYLLTEQEGKVFLTLPQLTVLVNRSSNKVVLVLKTRRHIYTDHATSEKFA